MSLRDLILVFELLYYLESKKINYFIKKNQLRVKLLLMDTKLYI